MGTNPRLHSKVSMKMWKIQCDGRDVTTWWGRGGMDARKRRAIPRQELQTKTRSFRTAAEAREFESALIREKLSEGYERNSRGR
jgi:predicted DNA-binding WGR domain protein